MTGKPVQIVAAGALIDADGRVLLARRPAGKPLAGFWEFPGGKLEAGESPEACLIRELHEELGLDSWQSCLAPLSFASHDYDSFHLILLLFVCRRWQNSPQAKEGGELAWVRAPRLGDYEMPPANRPLIAALQDLL